MKMKIIYLVVFFLIIFIFGFLVTHNGKPYSVLLLTIHKLTGVAAGVYLVVNAVQMHKEQVLSTGQIASLVATVVCFLGLIVTGGMLSTEKEMPSVVTMVHRYFPYLTVISTAVSVYLLK